MRDLEFDPAFFIPVLFLQSRFLRDSTDNQIFNYRTSFTTNPYNQIGIKFSGAIQFLI